jgi:hypothetical protein
MPSVRTKAAREGLATYCFSGSAAEKSYKLYSAAPRATILNDVPTFSVGDAFLDLHCLFTNNAVQKTDQRAFIVVQMISRSYRLHHFPSPSAPRLQIEIINNCENDQRNQEPLPNDKARASRKLSVEICLA